MSRGKNHKNTNGRPASERGKGIPSFCGETAFSRVEIRIFSAIFTPKNGKEIEIMENRVAVIAIIVEKVEKSSQVNAILHDYNELIIGRMGLPYRSRNVYIINIVLDASTDQINAVAGKLGRIEGVTAKAVYSGIA